MHPKWMHPERYFEPYKTSPLSDLMLKGKFYFFVKCKSSFRKFSPTRQQVIHHLASCLGCSPKSTLNGREWDFRIARHLSLVCQLVALPKGSRVDLILSNLFGVEVSGVNLSSLRPRQINLSRFRVFNHLF